MKRGESTASFNGIIDHHGKFFCGIADMEVLEHLPREHLDRFKFWDSKVLLVDSNLNLQTLEYVLSRSAGVEHVIYETISEVKALKILHKDYLSKLTCIKPNLI